MLLIALLMLVITGLLSGFPVAFVLGGASLLIALLGAAFDMFDINLLAALPGRIYGIMNNSLLLAVMLFIFMGVTLQKAEIARKLLIAISNAMGAGRGSLPVAVIIVGAILAASTGIVGATVVTMGLISLPAMLQSGVNARLATGVIAASGTLGQIIPPSIVLILLGDQISNANQTAQMAMGNFSPDSVSVADLFMGALAPGILLVSLYIIWVVAGTLISRPCPVETVKRKAEYNREKTSMWVVTPPLLLIFIVLGSMLAGVATATESAAIGALGALILAATMRRISLRTLREICIETAMSTSMVFTILIGATVFSLVFRGFGGDEIIHRLLSDLPGGMHGALFIVMISLFLMGFFLDFIEIIFVVIPLVVPPLIMMGADPLWLAIMIAVNLQTSFLTPPFGFALFYLRGVTPKEIATSTIYRGVMPFIFLQIVALAVLWSVPQIATYLPEKLYKNEALTLPAPQETETRQYIDIPQGDSSGDMEWMDGAPSQNSVDF